MRTLEGDDVGFFDGDLVGTGLVGEELGLFEGLLLGVDVGLVVGDFVGNGVVGEELGLGFDSFSEQRDCTSHHELSRELSRVISQPTCWKQSLTVSGSLYVTLPCLKKLKTVC